MASSVCGKKTVTGSIGTTALETFHHHRHAHLAGLRAAGGLHFLPTAPGRFPDRHRITATDRLGSLDRSQSDRAGSSGHALAHSDPRLGLGISLLQILGVRQAGALISFVTPGPQFGGEPLQVLWLWRRYRVPGPTALLAVGLDRFFELFVNFSVLLVAVLLLLGSGATSRHGLEYPFRTFVWHCAVDGRCGFGAHSQARVAPAVYPTSGRTLATTSSTSETRRTLG